MNTFHCCTLDLMRRVSHVFFFFFCIYLAYIWAFCICANVGLSAEPTGHLGVLFMGARARAAGTQCEPCLNLFRWRGNGVPCKRGLRGRALNWKHNSLTQCASPCIFKKRTISSQKSAWLGMFLFCFFLGLLEYFWHEMFGNSGEKWIMVWLLDQQSYYKPLWLLWGFRATPFCSSLCAVKCVCKTT